MGVLRIKQIIGPLISIGIIVIGFGIFYLILKWNKISKIKKRKTITDMIISFLFILSSIITIKMFQFFPTTIAQMVMIGYKQIFSGGLNLNYFIAALYLSFSIFVYTGFCFFLCIFLMLKEKGYRGKWDIIITKNSLKAFKKLKNYLLLIFTITISISLICSGILFLSTAFPNEPLFNSVIKGDRGSILNCTTGNYKDKYSNLISQFDVVCSIMLSKEFQDKELESAYYFYYIDRIKNKKEIPNTHRESVVLYFDKEVQPTFLHLKFINYTDEVFKINHVGVYTKEEYFEREKEKAIWFFFMISLSIFSVFSAMSNLKNILDWK